MGKTNFKGLIKTAQDTLEKHSPEILTGVGIAGMVTTTILAVKATPKALRLIESERVNRKFDRDNGIPEVFAPEEISVKDTIKLCWKCYIPAAITCFASIACLIGASSVNLRRNAALATAYKLSETALSEYKDAVVDTIGEKKEKMVKDKISEKQVKNNPVSNNEVIVTEKGNTLCYDHHSGRYFNSDIEKIKKSVNEINRIMLRDSYVSLNEFYDELGLDHTKIGDELGWNINDGFLELYFSSQITEDGTPCLVINYENAPRYGYSKFM